MEEEALILEKASKASLQERVGNKLWKARKQAYEHMLAELSDASSDVQKEYAQLGRKLLLDTNVGAQEVACDVILLLLKSCPSQLLSEHASGMCDALVKQAFNQRPSIVLKSEEIMLRLVEHGFAEQVVSACGPAFLHKVPKVALAALNVVLHALQAFGNKVISPKLFIASLIAVFDTKDKKARDKGKDIVVELTRWLKAADVRSAVVSHLRDAQQSEMEVLLGKQAAAPGVPSRFLRSNGTNDESAAKSLVALSGPGPTAHPVVTVVDDGDDGGLDLPAVDVVAKLPKTFWKDVVSPKWSERRDALIRLREAATVPRAVATNWFDVVNALKKIMQKDSNAVCVAEAAACVAAISTSVRRPFAQAAKGTLMPLCLDKLKDKSSVVKQRCLDAMTAMQTHCLHLTDCLDVLLASFASPSPQAKGALLIWLAHSISREPAADLPKIQAALLPTMVQLTNDPISDVRDAAAGAIAAFGKASGSLGAIEKHLKQLTDRRRAQVEACFAGDSTSQQGKDGVAESAPTAHRARAHPVSSTARTTVTSASAPGALTASRVKDKSHSSEGRPTSGPGDGDDGAGQMGKESALEHLESIFGSETAAGLADSLWKTRLSAMQSVVEGVPKDVVQASAVKTMQALSQVPGWKDSNFQVINKVCIACEEMAAKLAGLKRSETSVVVAGAVEKLADSKVKSHAKSLLSQLVEASSLAAVSQNTFNTASKHKSPKVIQEAASWITQAVADFGGRGLPTQLTLPWVKHLLAHSSPAVRDSAIELVVILHAYQGDALLQAIKTDTKPQVLAKVEEGIQKRPVLAEPARCERRAVTSRSALSHMQAPATPGKGASPIHVMEEEAEEDSQEPPATASKVDITSSLTDKLLAQLADSNWKERRAAVEQVEGIVSAAGDCIESRLGGLLPALAQRLDDTNRNLAAQVIRLIARLLRAMGHAADTHSRMIIAAVLRHAGDGKPAVRSAIHECLLAQITVCGWQGLSDAIVASMHGPKSSGLGKCTVLDTVFEALNTGLVPRSSVQALPVLQACATGLLDKAIEPRKSATRCLHLLSQDQMALQAAHAALADLGAAERGSVMEHLPAISGAQGALAGSPSPSRPGTAPDRASRTRPGTAQAAARPGTTTGVVRHAPHDRAAPARRAPAPTSSGGISKAGSGVSSISASDAASEGPLILFSPADGREARHVPQRSLKFEIKVNEEKLVQGALSPFLSAPLATQMFSADFRKHVAACDTLIDNMDKYGTEMTHLLDLFLRWAVLRFADEKNQSLLRVQAFVSALLSMVQAARAEVLDNDANVILPCLCTKVGHNQDRARHGFGELLTKFRAIYDPHRFVVFLLEGMAGKNVKSRADCCDQLAETLREHGCAVLFKGPRSKRTGTAVKRVAALTAERDNALRQAALGALMVIYEQEGLRLWTMLGDDLKATHRDLIAERMKYADKAMAKRGAPAGSVACAAHPVIVQAPSVGSADGSSHEVARNGREPTGSNTTSVSGTAFDAGGSIDAEQVCTASEASDNGTPTIKDMPPVVSREPAAHAAPSIVSAVPAAPFLLRSTSGTERPSAAERPAVPAAAPTPPEADGDMPASPALVHGPAHAGARRTSGGTELAPVPAMSPSSPYVCEGHFGRFFLAMQELKAHPSYACIEPIKSLFYTLAALVEGPNVESPVSDAERDAMKPYTSELLQELMQRMPILTHEAQLLLSETPPSTNPLRGLRYMMNCVWKLYDNDDFVAMADVKSTATIVAGVLAQLANHRTFQETFGDSGQELLRIMNVIMSKVMDKAPRNTAFAALLACLLNVPAVVEERGPGQLHCFRELAVRCLIKLTRQLNSSDVDIERLLLDMDKYFSAIGADKVRELIARGDRPIKMVKTMLYELCKTKGLIVLRTAQHIFGVQERPNKPLVMIYIEVNFKSFADIGLFDKAVIDNAIDCACEHDPAIRAGAVDGAHPASDNRAAPSSCDDPAAQQPASKSPGRIVSEHERSAAEGWDDRGSPRWDLATNGHPLQMSNAGNVACGDAPALHIDAHQRKQVSEIFVRIGVPSTTYQGLEELYDFLSANADLPIDQLMLSTSDSFKRYIRKGLQKVNKKHKKRKGLSYPRTQLQSVPEDQGSIDSSYVGEQERSSEGSEQLAERLSRIEETLC